MEISKGDDHSTEHAATLLGSPRQDNQMRHSEQVKKRNSRNCRITLGVLLLCLLGVLILAVVFALKQRCDIKVTSCRSRCMTGSRDRCASCHCDPSCEGEGTCCLDYQEVCVDPDETKSWLKEECEDITTPQCPAGFSKPPLILVSLDGFRAEYLKAHSDLLPVISKLRRCGTTTPHMRPAYPTKTFPNHYTIVTGLYPESHGIVDNKMYDVTQNASFSLKSAEKFNPKWYQGEPVWLTAIYNNLKSATYYWPGSDVAIKGWFPDIYRNYDQGIPFEKRVATILEWLNLTEGERPDFYTLYTDEPDSSGHRHGPTSEQVVEALQKVDRLLGVLLDGLKERKLHRCVNLVVLSDHGMEEASCAKATYVSSYQDNTQDFTVLQGPAARVRPVRIPEDFFSFDYEGLVKNLSCQIVDQPMRPFLKEHLPKRMHFANNVRIERAHLYMRSGWQAALQREDIKYCSGGFHGSDNVFQNMQTIFMGYGPGLKYKTIVPPFENIEVYNLLCDLLDIPPAPNNGTHGSLNHLLRQPVHLPVYPAELSQDTPCEARGLAPAEDLGCSCSSRTQAAEKALNQQLLKTIASSKAEIRPHLPYGTPRVLQENADFCVLHQSDYINGYSKDLHMPLWVAYTLPAQVRVQALGPEALACVRADVRVPAGRSQTCTRYTDDPALSLGLLHPPNLSSSGAEGDSLVTSNMAPMFPAFKDVWTYFHDVLVPQWSRQLNGVNVMSGPVFDRDYDGRYDAPSTSLVNQTPTHYFVILSSCGNWSFPPEDCEGPLQVQAFILPHRADHTETCASGSDLHWVEEWAQFHAARVRDIELLTGLSFYHARMSVDETLRLKTFLKTYV